MSGHQLATSKEEEQFRQARESSSSENQDNDMVQSSDSSSSGDLSVKGETLRFGDFEVRKDSLTLIVGLVLLGYEVYS